MSEQVIGPVGSAKFGGPGTLAIKGHYGNGRIALHVFSDGGPLYTATVNLPDEDLDDGCVFLKEWGGNIGVPEALELAGHVRLTGRTVPAGWTEAVEAELLFDLDSEPSRSRSE